MSEKGEIISENLQTQRIQTISQSNTLSNPTFLEKYENEVWKSLLQAYFDDLEHNNKLEDGFGWRNRYQIHVLSGVPQKKIYSVLGPVDRLLSVQVIERRQSPSKWGKQKFQYRIIIHEVSAYA